MKCTNFEIPNSKIHIKQNLPHPGDVVIIYDSIATYGWGYLMFGRLRSVKRHILNMDINQQSQYINKKTQHSLTLSKDCPSSAAAHSKQINSFASPTRFNCLKEA